MSWYFAKLWIEMLDDWKVQTLPDSSWRRFVECILLAREESQEGFLPTLDAMAFRLRIPKQTLHDDMSRLALAGLVELRQLDGEERWYVTNFGKRQAAVGQTERKQLSRKKQTLSRSVTGDVTKRDTDKRYRDRDLEIEKGREEDRAHARDGDDNDDNDAAIAAGKRILARWQQLTGRSAPRDDSEWWRDWLMPVNQLWARVGRDEDAAFEVLASMRRQMVDAGKTPFRPSAVVPYALAEMDRSTAPAENGRPQTVDEWTNYFAEA